MQAERFQQTLPVEKEKKVLVIRKPTILEQLICFLGCMGTNWIPVIVPYDSREDIKALAAQVKVPQEAIMAVATSGTTGVPKLLFRTYDSWAGFFPEQNRIFRVTEESRLFAQGSLAFTGNLNLYLAQFSAGGTMVAEDAFVPERWAERIRQQNVNAVYLIPAKLLLLPRIMKEDYAGVKTILAGSQSLGQKDAAVVKTIFPGAQIILYYGASELNYITYVTDTEMTGQRNLIGKPFPGVTVTVKDEELFVDTPWHVEGITMPYSLKDKGYQDAEGNFYFLGRSDDIVNIRGRKISLLKIQNHLEQFLEVQEAAVLYQKETDKGPVAFVVLKKEIPVGALAAKLREKLAHYEMPRKIMILQAIPKNESGKTDKKKLLWQLEQEK